MGWYEALKDTVTVADRLRDAELKQRLASLQVECAKLAEDNALLRQERNELRDQINARTEMSFDQNVYWRKSSSAAQDREGPFCPKCRDGSRKSARMEDQPNDDHWRCTVCDCTIQKPGRSNEAGLAFRPRDDRYSDAEY